MRSPLINATTKDYELVNGNIINQNALQSMAYTRLITPRGTYLFDKNFGNPLLTKKYTQGQINQQTLKREVNIALEDMITLGYIKNLIIITSELSLAESRVAFTIIMTDNFGEQTPAFTWNLTL